MTNGTVAHNVEEIDRLHFAERYSYTGPLLLPIAQRLSLF
jgi:hypothetical protein